VGLIETIRRWIDGETTDDILEEADEHTRPRRVWEEFLVKIAREVEACMQREMFTPPGGVNISRCITASTSRAILTRNSSQTRRGRACSSTSSRRSSAVSPSIQRLIDSSKPIFWSAPTCRRYQEKR
jgi:hypothetical protein